MDLLTDHLAEARRALRQRDWGASHAAFVRADGLGPLALDDVEAFATTAWRLGHASEAVRLSERVYDRLVRADPGAAAMAASDLALKWLTRGDVNICRIWLDRCRRLLDPASVAPTHGYLRYVEAVVAIRTRAVGQLPARARALRDAVTGPGAPELVALALIVSAVEELTAGRVEDGRARVDAAIPALESGEVRVEWAGDVYGLLLFDCRNLADPPTLTGWAESMANWCDGHDAPLYHRALRVHLAASERELLAQGSTLVGVHGLAAAAAFRRLGEMRRLRGDADGAADADERARRLGVG